MRTITIICLVAVIIPLSLLFTWLTWPVKDFIRELRYVNCEISRTTKKEKKYWIRRRRRLILSIIPFVPY